VHAANRTARTALRRDGLDPRERHGAPPTWSPPGTHAWHLRAWS